MRELPGAAVLMWGPSSRDLNPRNHSFYPPGRTVSNRNETGLLSVCPCPCRLSDRRPPQRHGESVPVIGRFPQGTSGPSVGPGAETLVELEVREPGLQIREILIDVDVQLGGGTLRFETVVPVLRIDENQ